MKRSQFVAFFTPWLLILSACNLPTQANRIQGIPPQALRQTLVAQATSTARAPTIGPGSTLLSSATWSADVSPFTGLHTATPGNPLPTDMLGQQTVATMFSYYTQAGDTLAGLTGRFGVDPSQIVSMQDIPATGLIPTEQLLQIPNVLGALYYPSALMPDSEVIASPSAIGFDVQAFVDQAGGYISTYQEMVGEESLSGVQIVQRVALESSVNPRFLLALLEYRSGWVYGQPRDSQARNYPIGFHVAGQTGLYRELVMTATHLNAGYYGWRGGTLIEVKFRDASQARLSPALNAGSIAVQHLFSKFYKQDAWRAALYGTGSFVALYQNMFGTPWARAAPVEPLFPQNLAQPTLELPFMPGERWSLTGGPHPAWKTGSPRGALDLAPVTGEQECAVSRAWVLASAPGLVVRSERNVVAIDLDGDGYEQTGWVIIYMHVADRERVVTGTWVQTDSRLGHPSCEGGTSTGTHVHIARKFNGEWIAADGPLPFVLSGWQAFADARNYYGGLRKGEQMVVASPVGPQTSIVVR